MVDEKKEVEVPIDHKMMNLTLHVQKDFEVELVKKLTSLTLERSPQGVYIGRGEEGLQRAIAEVVSKLNQLKYVHILVGGSSGLVAGLIRNFMEAGNDIAMYEFESEKKRDVSTGRQEFKPVGIRRIF